ncbi:MerR family transcriptional regulator [Myxococcus llanfairpwllgwyngyllgogerychwyrndrobwllllantysiliogogogochensis]|uniref:MerR family transcriptional regulator n=1 Tax=Myxococcus llanfairpwllgwyngyllgogerychwyrndrobwllllantysiliogogogochensis TaxID=2590453 RepID=A0A540X287_9BACT|nr:MULTISPECIES: MerR family transcriptional regulator [Myxococcus]NTX33138.1 MerR family transcriptional regulator [Myxococcus sp. CA033]TQF14784.1 MerR family transcriptional regulator [Myxococcus llanfairpwllgwyngyllgogerychwyrndrobwllllantysiliogogogochensis]
MALTVSQVARLAKVSVRALHHYDELGLLCPSGRSEAGYRLYTQADLERLQQVLFFRELAFPLEEIRRILGDPRFDLRAALLMQRQLLTERASRLDALRHAVDAALDALDQGKTMDSEKMFEAFGDFDPSKYEAEVKERWGDTEAYKESARRTSRYKKEDWSAIKAEGDQLMKALAEHLGAGRAPTEPDVLALAEAHRQYISKWFYPCSYVIHRGLGEMYVSDSRFTENIDSVKPGLSRYLRDAFVANAERNGVES